MVFNKKDAESSGGESKDWGFCDTCKFFVQNKSVRNDIKGACHESPSIIPVTQADRHWCRHHQIGKQRVVTSSSAHPEGTNQIIDGKKVDQTTLTGDTV